MARQKGGLKRAERRQPEPSPIVISDADAAPRSAPRPATQPPQTAPAGSKSKSKKRGGTSKAENRAKVQRAIENADRLQMKSAKRANRDEKRKRARE
ncbi:hypothetical protein FA10DRAFT_263886 [Acaromyces ingoldii]|uniref:Uncharacterized protein n=1 Tax=Acaromyces ingoldii TaxID=215250 RepID=A0A316YVC2_9BASI|nr:hypothetical protein FA10DRAFT_263886 [Acaromyces ingoldii]PWN93201.1 hypothetical protein FA10DRAFT_263886 [Acaromyces ingoldii]